MGGAGDGGGETREEGREQPSVGPQEQMGACGLAGAPRGTDRDSPGGHLLPPLPRGQESANVPHAAQHVAGGRLCLPAPGSLWPPPVKYPGACEPQSLGCGHFLASPSCSGGSRVTSCGVSRVLPEDVDVWATRW